LKDRDLFRKDFSARAPRVTGTGAQLMQDADGREIATAYSTIDPLGWRVFVEVSNR
jgi:hypothetical protein